MQQLTRSLWAAGALALAGCAGASPTFADVQPRLASCLGCHERATADRPSFATLADVRTNARAMLAAVDVGIMPPGGLDVSGACRTYRDLAPFTQEDRDVLAAWIDAGMPDGDASAGATGATAGDAPRFDRSVGVDLPLSDDDGDVHRCHLVHVGAGSLRGVHVDGDAGVHHAMIFALDEHGAALARAADARDAGDGWSCPSTPLVPSTLAFAWVPGRDTVAFPDGAGVPVGDDVIVQIHQHGASSALVHLDLLLGHADDVVTVTPLALAGFSLPPDAAHVELARTLPLPFAPHTRILGVMPHMHQAGRAARVDVDVDGACLADAPRFDFQFQQVAFYEAPVDVDAGARATLTCAWDTRGRTSDTPWGESSDDEMCTVFLFTTTPS